jgi:hypothetical protein
LVTQAFTKGSRHKAPCPALKTSQVNEESGEVSFEWEAAGSSGGSYQIHAVGALQLDLDDRGNPVGRGLKVTCSCPDGKRQAAVSLKESKIVVCKHAASALESVLDDGAQSRYESNLARIKQERQEVVSLKRQEEEQAKQEQDRQMPGERARIEYGLKALSRDEIHRQLEASCKTVEGLRALTTIFPESIVPVPQTKYCVRCKKNYDGRYSEQKVCRLRHTHQLCHTEWDGSKVSWEHCYRCDGDFGIPDFYRKSPYDVGEWCFQCEHTQDETLIEEEKWNADPSDLLY